MFVPGKLTDLPREWGAWPPNHPPVDYSRPPSTPTINVRYGVLVAVGLAGLFLLPNPWAALVALGALALGVTAAVLDEVRDHEVKQGHAAAKAVGVGTPAWQQAWARWQST